MNSEPSHDAAIVARVRAGDLDAFETIFRAHYEELVRFAHATVRSVDVAQDLVSEMFTTLYERRETWEIRTSVRAYLVAATRYRIINYVRDFRRRGNRYAALQVAGEEDEAIPSLQAPDVELIEAEERGAHLAAVERALAELTPRSRMVVALRWRQGLSFEEIAEVMETTSAAVQMQLSRALKVLRERAPTYLK
jgi:RNA polymerase sigma-70 factor (ECF subfamily)